MDPSPVLLVTQSSLLGVGLQDEAAEVFQGQLLVKPPLMIFHLTNPQSTNLEGKLKLFDAMITMFQKDEKFRRYSLASTSNLTIPEITVTGISQEDITTSTPIPPEKKKTKKEICSVCG